MSLYPLFWNKLMVFLHGSLKPLNIIFCIITISIQQKREGRHNLDLEECSSSFSSSLALPNFRITPAHLLVAWGRGARTQRACHRARPFWYSVIIHEYLTHPRNLEKMILTRKSLPLALCIWNYRYFADGPKACPVWQLRYWSLLWDGWRRSSC